MNGAAGKRKKKEKTREAPTAPQLPPAALPFGAHRAVSSLSRTSGASSVGAAGREALCISRSRTTAAGITTGPVGIVASNARGSGFEIICLVARREASLGKRLRWRTTAFGSSGAETVTGEPTFASTTTCEIRSNPATMVLNRPRRSSFLSSSARMYAKTMNVYCRQLLSQKEVRGLLQPLGRGNRECPAHARAGVARARV